MYWAEFNSSEGMLFFEFINPKWRYFKQILSFPNLIIFNHQRGPVRMYSKLLYKIIFGAILPNIDPQWHTLFYMGTKNFGRGSVLIINGRFEPSEFCSQVTWWSLIFLISHNFWGWDCSFNLSQFWASMVL